MTLVICTRCSARNMRGAKRCCHCGNGLRRPLPVGLFSLLALLFIAHQLLRICHVI